MGGGSSFWPAAVNHIPFTHLFDPFANDLPLLACFGGMLFGQDIGAIRGVLVMPPFVK
jgi:hypothetical protein